ncbi:MAG: hypothetical protein JNM62_01015 [Flavobacteriales bacterium]|nr:hypothetical protein [Flavobacteriales bacterium]
MTERIDHSNYEAWLLDQLEGTLTPEQERELQAFLLLNPHLAPSSGELPFLAQASSTLTSMEKEALKRNIPPTGSVDHVSVDAHLIARLENDLTTEQREALRLFLLDHPEHHLAERIYALTKLVPVAVAFAAKRGLERHFPPLGAPNAFNLDDFLVARMEGDLGLEQQVALDDLLGLHDSHGRAATLMNAARIKPDSVVFQGKEGLKKREGRVLPFVARVWTVRLAAAASLALLIGLALWSLRSQDVDEREIARVPTTVQERPRSAPEVEHAPINEQGAGHSQNDASDTSAAMRTAKKQDSLPGSAPVPPVPNAEQRPAQESVEPPASRKEEVPMEGTPSTNDMSEPLLAQASAQARSAVEVTKPLTVRELIAGTLRDRVLDQAERTTEPLDDQDAVAVVDKSLKAVGGDRTGLVVTRKADGRVRSFDLRLGRNFSVSASR